MSGSFDVVVVGARCAGAPLATLLAREGLKVCLLDRSRFPSEVPSTHAIQPNGVSALRRFGLEAAIRATGAPAITKARFDLDGVVVDVSDGAGILEFGDSPMFCIRRSTLDQLLIDAAVGAGADFRPGTAATGLVHDNGRVVGVETPHGTVAASLVVGADGPHSGVARMVGAREYHTTPPGRLFMWGYFEGVGGPGGVANVEPRIFLGKHDDTALLAAPTDGDLFLVAVVPSQDEKRRCLADTAGALKQGLACFEDVAAVVGDADLQSPVRTMARWHGYFRDATGPGWVLVGDAGHFKDPTPGQGIADAFRQVEHLAPAIVAGLGSGDIDSRLVEWGRWRDRDAWEMYWFATDLGAPGPTSPLVREMIRRLVAGARGPERFMRVFDHDLAPSKVFTPPRAMSAAVSLAASGRVGPRVVGQEMMGIVGREVARRRLRRKPEYLQPGVGEVAQGADTESAVEANA